jgi:hypothetical protein
MDDRVQLPEGLPIGERQVRQRAAVHIAVAREDPLAEERGHPGLRLRCRERFLGEEVRVHRVGPRLSEEPGDGALSGADPAEEPDHHVSPSPRTTFHPRRCSPRWAP